MTAPQHVEVEMKHALACIFAYVRDHPPPSIYFQSNVLDHGKHLGEQCRILLADLGRGLNSMWRLGMTNTWVGATGLTSSKARTFSVSARMLAGMSPATIEQNKQSLIRRPRVAAGGVGSRSTQMGNTGPEEPWFSKGEAGCPPGTLAVAFTTA